MGIRTDGIIMTLYTRRDERDGFWLMMIFLSLWHREIGVEHYSSKGKGQYKYNMGKLDMFEWKI